MSRYPMTDPITIPPFPQNEKEVPCGLLFSFLLGSWLTNKMSMINAS